MQKRGQGSLEYLLIIGGGILVAVVIIGAIVSLAGTGTGGTKANVANQTCHTYLDQLSCSKVLHPGIGADADVTKLKKCDGTDITPDADENACCWNPSVGAGTKCYVNANNTYS